MPNEDLVAFKVDLTLNHYELTTNNQDVEYNMYTFISTGVDPNYRAIQSVNHYHYAAYWHASEQCFDGVTSLAFNRPLDSKIC
jgi:hypothetical protein